VERRLRHNMASFKVEKRDYQLIVTVRLHLNEKLNEYGLNDFSEKFVLGLLKAKKINKKKIQYTGHIGISLYNRLQNPMSKEEFFFIMEQFVDLFQEMEKAQLDVRKIVSDLRNVYINGQTTQIQFIYLPLQTIQNTNLLEIMYSIIYKVKPIAGEDDGYILRFISFSVLITGAILALQSGILDNVSGQVTYKLSSILDVFQNSNGLRAGYNESGGSIQVRVEEMINALIEIVTKPYYLPFGNSLQHCQVVN